MEEKQLVKLALEAREYSYSPYSKFRVGAVVYTDKGNVYNGSNIENVSYGATNCAERTAIFKAVSNNDRKIKAVAIASDSEDFIYPCGICRQVMAEFGDKDTKVICSKSNGEFKIFTLAEILPNAFLDF